MLSDEGFYCYRSCPGHADYSRFGGSWCVCFTKGSSAQSDLPSSGVHHFRQCRCDWANYLSRSYKWGPDLKDNHTDHTVIGKANLTLLSNLYGKNTPNGWSQTGGCTKSALGDQVDPMGSSTGSAVGLSAGFCALAIGAETNGSLVSDFAFLYKDACWEGVDLSSCSVSALCLEAHSWPGLYQRRIRNYVSQTLYYH